MAVAAVAAVAAEAVAEEVVAVAAAEVAVAAAEVAVAAAEVAAVAAEVARTPRGDLVHDIRVNMGTGVCGRNCYCFGQVAARNVA